MGLHRRMNSGRPKKLPVGGGPGMQILSHLLPGDAVAWSEV